MFKALGGVHKHLAPVFATVAEPFPAQVRNAGIPLGKIKRIRELRAQGYTAKKAAEIVGVNDDTVRKYATA